MEGRQQQEQGNSIGKSCFYNQIRRALQGGTIPDLFALIDDVNKGYEEVTIEGSILLFADETEKSHGTVRVSDLKAFPTAKKLRVGEKKNSSP